MFVLDTNVVSELRRIRPHGAVLAWFKKTPSRDIFVSAVTIGEIQTGIEKTRDNDAAKADEIEDWLNEQIPTFNVIPVDDAIFRVWAKFMHRASDDHLLDAMIAATARVRGATVVTRNVRDFKQFGVPIVNPFS
jgi:toxin FitB